MSSSSHRLETLSARCCSTAPKTQSGRKQAGTLDMNTCQMNEYNNEPYSPYGVFLVLILYLQLVDKQQKTMS